MGFHTRRATPAKGSSQGTPTLRVAIAFPPELWERLAGEAGRRQLPFAQIVREKVLDAYQHEADMAELLGTKAA